MGEESTNKSKYTKINQSGSEHMIGIHVFRDASFRKTYAAAYAVMQQPTGIKQGLFESK